MTRTHTLEALGAESPGPILESAAVKSVLAGIAAAIVLAFVAALVLDFGVQRSAETQYQTSGTRL
jgi:hypothetical protein